MNNLSQIYIHIQSIHMLKKICLITMISYESSACPVNSDVQRGTGLHQGYCAILK